MSSTRPLGWDQLEWRLATWGIPADVDEDVSATYTPDPWRPPPNEEIVVVKMTKDAASKLCNLLPDPMAAKTSTLTRGDG